MGKNDPRHLFILPLSLGVTEICFVALDSNFYT